MNENELKAGDAAVSGQASIIRAADKVKGALQAQPAKISGVITVIRAGTGKVEHFPFSGDVMHGAPESSTTPHKD